MIESNCLEFLNKLSEILISGFQENSQKPDFWAKMAKFWTKKVQKWPKNSFITTQTYFKKQKLANKHQQTGRNWSKMVKNLNLSPQAMDFWPKMGRNGQKRIFPDTTLPLNDWKQLSRVSDQVTWNSQENSQKPDFWAKMAKFWTKKGKKWPIFFITTQIYFILS